MQTNRQFRPAVEVLEDRTCPASGKVSLSSGLLEVEGTDRADVIDVRPSADGTRAVVALNGMVKTYSLSKVKSVRIEGRDGDDDLSNRLQVPAKLRGNDGDDRLNDFSGRGDGKGGDGNDQLYFILGANKVDGGSGKDRIISNAASKVKSDQRDEVPVIFGQATQPGFSLLGGVLYYVPAQGDNSVLIVKRGDKIVASSNGASQTFKASAVKSIATVLGGGNDSFVVRVPGVDVVAYGSGGNDVLDAGRADFTLLKGGGGDDRLDASAAKRADLSGDPGRDTLLGGRGKDVLRADAVDAVFAGRNDRVIRN